MAQWKAELDLRPEYQQAKGNLKQLKPLARTIGNRLGAMPLLGIDVAGKNSLAAEFHALGRKRVLTVAQFDKAMAELYDWADTARVWVITVGGKR